MYMKVKRVDPKSSHLMGKKHFSLSFLFISLCEVMHVNWAYCGNYCTRHVSHHHSAHFKVTWCQVSYLSVMLREGRKPFVKHRANFCSRSAICHLHVVCQRTQLKNQKVLDSSIPRAKFLLLPHFKISSFLFSQLPGSTWPLQQAWSIRQWARRLRNPECKTHPGYQRLNMRKY